jgi:hypothetical protein
MTKAEKQKLMHKAFLHLKTAVELAPTFKPNPFVSQLYNTLRALSAVVEELVNDLPDDESKDPSQ